MVCFIGLFLIQLRQHNNRDLEGNLMTLYRNCDLTHASLNENECAIFIVLRKTGKLFGAPVFGTYCEIKGRFSIEENQIKTSYDIVKPEIWSKKELYDPSEETDDYDDYTIEEHKEYLTASVTKNNMFSTFVMLKSVYDNLSVNSEIPFFNSCEEELMDQLKTSSNTEVMLFKMFDLLNSENENNGKNFLESQPQQKFFIEFETQNIFKSFIENENEDNMFKVIDLVRKEKGFNIWITEVVNQPSINHYFKQDYLSTKEAVSLYLNALKVRTIVGTVKPQVESNIKSYHQGRGIDYYIEYYKALIKGLEEHLEK